MLKSELGSTLIWAEWCWYVNQTNILTSNTSVLSMYLQCSKQDTTCNRNTDFIVVVGLLFAIWKPPIYLLENED